MRRISASKCGLPPKVPQLYWEDLRLNPPWPEVIRLLNVGRFPRDVQIETLRNQRILEHRRNLLISAPTNSGKSLIGLLVLLEAVRRGKRAVLLEPLRAIAREKMEELSSAAANLSKVLCHPFTIRISTGDYRLDDETLAAPPPAQGEIIIATPERYEALLRNPAYDNWASSIEAVCVDEAHLISSPKRGPTLEYLLTYLLCLPSPPRIVLLSGTLGNTERAREWLSPCDVISLSERYPPLRKQVFELEPEEDPNQVVTEFAQEALADPDANLLVFVYQTRSAERLALLLNESLGEFAGTDGALAYHAQMSLVQRERVRSSVSGGRCRIIVATTALGLGMNLPVTHVIIRDSTFAGVGPLSLAEILQMMGRAGRGDLYGYAAVIVRPHDAWKAEALTSALRNEKLPELTSYFGQTINRAEWRGELYESARSVIATYIAAQLSRRPESGCSAEELRIFFDRSFGARALAAQVPSALSWLIDPVRALAFIDEHGKYRLTVLGLAATRSAFPLTVASGVGQLIRDLLSVDPTDTLLSEWRPLDSLIMVDLLSEQMPRLRPYSSGLAEQVDSWIEAHPQQASLLYRKWIMGGEGSSHAVELLGSLGIFARSQNVKADEWARRRAYSAVFHSAILHERGQGKDFKEIQRRWDINMLEGVEERWRDTCLWLLSGLSKVLDLRSFYYHLREECSAENNRIWQVKRSLMRMRHNTLALMDHLKYCSPLGPVLFSLRRAASARRKATVGLRTMQRLESAGIRNFAELTELQLDDLIQLGIRRDLAKQIRDYVSRRLQ